MVERFLKFFAGVLLLTGIFLALEYSPPFYDSDGKYLGEAFRIFFMHVPAAWNSFLCFLAAFVAGIGYLINRKPSWDIFVASCLEVGWVLACLVIVSGPIWARAAWGAYWTWEPRLTSFLVLWLVYLAGLILRGSIEDRETRARFTAAYAVLAFATVPIVVLSIHLWGAKNHPKPGPDFFGDPRIRATLFFNTFAFLAATVYLVGKRMKLERSR